MRHVLSAYRGCYLRVVGCATDAPSPATVPLDESPSLDGVICSQTLYPTELWPRRSERPVCARPSGANHGSSAGARPRRRVRRPDLGESREKTRTATFVTLATQERPQRWRGPLHPPEDPPPRGHDDDRLVARDPIERLPRERLRGHRAKLLEEVAGDLPLRLRKL